MRPFKAVVIGALLAIGLIVVLAQSYTQPYYGIFYGDGSNLVNLQGPSIVGNISVPNIFVLNLYGTNAIINQETVGQGTVTNLTALNFNGPVVANNNGFGTNEYFLNAILAGNTIFQSTNNYLTLKFLVYGTNFAGFDGSNFWSFNQLFFTNGWNWPVGSAAGTLQNDGSGNLTWTPVQGVTIPNTITPTNFVLNTTYTNTSGSIQLLDVSVALITATVSGNASIDLYADQSGGTSFTLQDRAAISTLAGVGLAVNYTNNLSGAVSNKACYYFTNSSSGAGNSAVLIAGTGERITLSDGAAAGVAFLASPNVFTANQFVDSAHTLSLSNSTANRMAIFANDHTLTNAGASGAVPIDADGSAATFAQVQALAPGVIMTNGITVPVTFSNNPAVDAAHELVISNATPSRLAFIRADNGVTNAIASGAVPINADSTATTFAQLNTIMNPMTNVTVLHAPSTTGSGYVVPFNNTTRYCSVFGNVGSVTTEANTSQAATFTCQMLNLYLRCNLGTSTNVVATLVTNGVASNLSVSMNGNGSMQTVSDTTHTVPVAAGTTVSISFLGNNPSAFGNVMTWSMQVQ